MVPQCCRIESPALSPYDPVLSSLSNLISYHSISHSQCLWYTKVFQAFRTMWLHILSLDGMSFPALLSSKHLHLLPICAEYLLFSLLDPYSSFPRLFCAQEIDLCGRHQWVLGQLGVSEGDRKERGNDSLLARALELAVSLAASPKLVHSPGLSVSCGKSSAATKLLYSPLRFFYIYILADKPSSKYK